MAGWKIAFRDRKGNKKTEENKRGGVVPGWCVCVCKWNAMIALDWLCAAHSPIEIKAVIKALTGSETHEYLQRIQT